MYCAITLGCHLGFSQLKLDHDIRYAVPRLVTIMLICQHDAILWLDMIKPGKQVADVSVPTDSEHSLTNRYQIRWWPIKMLIQYWESFLTPHQGAGAISASTNGNDVIQDGGRKRKLLLLLDGASKGLLILLTFALMGAFDYTTNGVTMPAHSCMTAWWGLGVEDQLIWVNS